MPNFIPSRWSPNALLLIALILFLEFLFVALLWGPAVVRDATPGACIGIDIPADRPEDVLLEGTGPEPDFSLFPLGVTCTFQRESGGVFVVDHRSWPKSALAILCWPVALGAASGLFIAARRRFETTPGPPN